MTWSQVNTCSPGWTYNIVNKSKTSSTTKVQQQSAHLRHKQHTIKWHKLYSGKGQKNWLTITQKCPKQTCSSVGMYLCKWLLHHSANIIQSRSFMHLSLNVIWTNSADLACFLCMNTWEHVTAQKDACCNRENSSSIIICTHLLV